MTMGNTTEILGSQNADLNETHDSGQGGIHLLYNNTSTRCSSLLMHQFLIAEPLRTYVGLHAHDWEGIGTSASSFPCGTDPRTNSTFLGTCFLTMQLDKSELRPRVLHMAVCF